MTHEPPREAHVFFAGLADGHADQRAPRHGARRGHEQKVMLRGLELTLDRVELGARGHALHDQVEMPTRRFVQDRADYACGLL